MTGSSRFVVLGLAIARSPWFAAVAQWSNSASIPVEFIKCTSAVELRAHLSTGRSHSAVLVDGAAPGLDRDLVDEARARGCAVVVVDGVRDTRDWLALGATAVINPVFGRGDLVEVLAQHTASIGRGDVAPGDPGAAFADTSDAGAPRAPLAMVCGPGGTGASTAAIALAQGLAQDGRVGGSVLLADLALHADQAMLHDARDVVPGLQDLVDAHRTTTPSREEVRTFTFDIERRGYQLLLGLRRARHWSTIRGRALDASVASLREGWDAVVCDSDADLEGEAEGGSADVEARHLLARTAAAGADVAFVVGRPAMQAVHGLVRVVAELLDHGVPAGRIVPVVNLAPKAARTRADLARAVAGLLQGRADAAGLPSPIFLPEHRVDEALRDGARLPLPLTTPVVAAFHAVLEREGPRSGRATPSLVVPGSLGHWAGAGVGRT